MERAASAVCSNSSQPGVWCQASMPAAQDSPTAATTPSAMSIVRALRLRTSAHARKGTKSASAARPDSGRSEKPSTMRANARTSEARRPSGRQNAARRSTSATPAARARNATIV